MNAMRDYLSGIADIYLADYRIRDAEENFHWYIDRGAAIVKDPGGGPLVIRGIVLDMGYYFNNVKLEKSIMEVFRRSEKTSRYLKIGFVVICSSCLKMEI